MTNPNWGEEASDQLISEDGTALPDYNPELAQKQFEKQVNADIEKDLAKEMKVPENLVKQASTEETTAALKGSIQTNVKKSSIALSGKGTPSSIPSPKMLTKK